MKELLSRPIVSLVRSRSVGGNTAQQRPGVESRAHRPFLQKREKVKTYEIIKKNKQNQVKTKKMDAFYYKRTTFYQQLEPNYIEQKNPLKTRITPNNNNK